VTAPTLDREDKDLVKRGRAEIKSLNEKLDAIAKSGWLDADGNMHVKPEAFAEYKTILDQAETTHKIVTSLERKSELDAWLDAPAGAPAALAAGGHAGAAPAPMQFKSLGQRFVESAEFKDHRDSGFMDRAFTIEDQELTAGVQFKDVHSGSIGTVVHPGFGTVQRAPMVTSPMLSYRVRDLFPQMNTSSVMIEFIEELGFVDPSDNAAAMVPEREGTAPNDNFGLKPKSNIRFNIKTTPIRTLAHWVPASRNVLDDEPQLRGIIDTRLMYGLKLVEDEQILLGDGTGQNLLGIFNTPGIQLFPSGSYHAPTNETYVDAIRRAATRVMLAQYDPTGVVVHPYDWERMELTKDSQGRYLVAGSVVSGAEKRLWQMPVVATPAIPEGTALIGAFGLGAQVFDRMQSNIRTSDQHADFFIRNAIVVLAEERLGLAVYRPSSMVKVDLAAAIAA
jgi:HK97 family phage major capsid protein